MKIAAIIPVRKGSQRVISKNSRPFSNSTLLDIRLTLLKEVKGLDHVIVNTDCEICKNIALSHGIEVTERDPYYTSSTVPGHEVIKHLAETSPGDAFFWSMITNPFLKKSTIEKSIERFRKGDIDSMVSVSPEKKFLLLDNKPVNFDPNNFSNSQSLPDMTSLNFAMSITRKDIAIEKEFYVGNTPLFTLLDKIQSIDIDDEEDFMIAEALFNKLGMDWVLS
jgi:CMP-N-acetylneuraminic acid synthetase